MSDSIPLIGLDAHAKTIAIAAAEVGRSEPRFFSTIAHDFVGLLTALAG